MLAIFLLCFLSAEARNTYPEENLELVRTATYLPILVEGDIVFEAGPASRGSIKDRLWDYGVFVYEIDSSLAYNSKAMDGIKRAMDDWSRTTCIKFRKRTTETAYVSFFQGGGWVEVLESNYILDKE